MTTLIGVAVLPNGTDLSATLAPLGVTLNGSPNGRSLFVHVDSWRRAETLAPKISAATRGTAFSVLAQTSADVYVVGEYGAGELLRQISFDRDGGGWLPPNGSPRPWETDFHLALPVDEFIDRLSDEDEWSDDDLDAARRAYEAREIEQLPRPAPSESQVRA
ncbi:MAG TPA: hypothetical protein VLB44_21255, partial [Kofleriaceae bacterium]|nr:hypothetical protein [Kofleriaceae bacterium]